MRAQGIAGKMLRLKDLLPRVNVSQLVAGCPALLLSYDVPLLEANLGKLRCAPCSLLCSRLVWGMHECIATECGGAFSMVAVLCAQQCGCRNFDLLN